MGAIESVPYDKPVFIGGCPRSGTTWLQYLLGDTNFFVTARETHLFERYINDMYKWYFNEQEYSKKEGLHSLYEIEAFEQYLVLPFALNVLKRIAKSKQDAPYLLEKTPSNALYTTRISRLFPNAKFIFVHRDPRAVVASYKAACSNKWGKWAAKSVEEVCFTWLRYSLAITEARKFSEHIEISYEELISDTAHTIRKVMDWLALDVTDINLNEIVSKNSIANLRSQSSDSWKYDERENFFRNGKIDKWKEELSKEEIIVIETVCGVQMKKYGYEGFN